MLNSYEEILSNPQYFKQLAVKKALLVNYQCPQIEKWVDLYSHFNHIIYTISGKKLLKTSSKSYLLTDGSLIFLKKGAIRQGRFFDTDWRVIVFCVPDDFLQQLFKEFRLLLQFHSIPPPVQDVIIEISTNDTINAFFNSLLPYFTQQPPPPENLLELKCRELMYNIFSQPANDALLSYLNSVCGSGKPLLAEIMEANYKQNLSLEEFAKISLRSLTVFKKEFTKTFNSSPGKWLLHKRLEYAQVLLSTSQNNVNEIVYEAGFESTTHFSRVFKEKFGLAPLQYRKQFAQAE